MIAMQYVFTLPADYDMNRIVDRVATKGAGFDRFPGLVFKTFLMSEVGKDGAVENRYAPFYVWQSAEAMRDFLTGAAFRTLVGSFGRPAIRTWLPLKVVPPSRAARTLDLVLEPVPLGSDLTGLTPAATDDVVGVDPTGWQLVRVKFDAETLSGDRYRVLHVSAPNQR